MSETCDSSNPLNHLVLCFYRGSLRFSLSGDDVQQMTWSLQQKFLEATAKSERVEKYPVNNKFSRLFFKKLIEYLEPSQEVHDDFYTYLCAVMDADDGLSYRHYVINNDLNNIVTIQETNNMVVNGTTGMRTWEAALMLADWALCNKEVFRNKTILELGSGIGFTGITIAKQCDIKSIILTDYHSDVLKTISNNIKINFPNVNNEKTCNGNFYRDTQNNLGVMMLDWHSIEDFPNDVKPDILIGADIVYDPSILQPLCNVIQTFFDRNKYLEVYIESVIRNEETFEKFLKTLESRNLSFEKLRQSKSVYIDWDNSTERCLLRICVNK